MGSDEGIHPRLWEMSAQNALWQTSQNGCDVWTSQTGMHVLHILPTNSLQPLDGCPQGGHSWLHLNHLFDKVSSGTWVVFSVITHGNGGKSLNDLQNGRGTFHLRKKAKASSFASRRVSFLQLNTLENWYFGTTLFPRTEGILLLRLVKWLQK